MAKQLFYKNFNNENAYIGIIRNRAHSVDLYCTRAHSILTRQSRNVSVPVEDEMEIE